MFCIDASLANFRWKVPFLHDIPSVFAVSFCVVNGPFVMIILLGRCCVWVAYSSCDLKVHVEWIQISIDSQVPLIWCVPLAAFFIEVVLKTFTFVHVADLGIISQKIENSSVWQHPAAVVRTHHLVAFMGRKLLTDSMSSRVQLATYGWME